MRVEYAPSCVSGPFPLRYTQQETSVTTRLCITREATDFEEHRFVQTLFVGNSYLKQSLWSLPVLGSVWPYKHGEGEKRK
jgi:hypothetical protein